MVLVTDLSEVLFYGMCGTENIVAERYGKEAAKAFYARHNELMDDLFHELLRGNMEEDEYWRIFLMEGHLPFGVEEAKQILSANMRKVVPDTLDVYKRIIACPRSLYRPGETIAEAPEIIIVSDHIHERIGELHDLHPDVFDIATREFWSCDSGQLKSDRNFFSHLLWALGLRCDEVIFVDDSVYNTTSAQLAGVTSILFRNAIQLESELEEYGFEFTPLDSSDVGSASA